MPIIFLLAIAVHLYVIVQTRREKMGVHEALRVRDFTHLLGVLQAIVDTMTIGFYVLLFGIFAMKWYMVVLIILAGLLLDLLLIRLMFRWFSKKGFLLWLACGLVVFGALGGIELRKDYLERITLEEQFDGDRIAAKKGEGALIAFVNGVIDEVLASGQYRAWFEEYSIRADELGL